MNMEGLGEKKVNIKKVGHIKKRRWTMEGLGEKVQIWTKSYEEKNETCKE